MDTMITSESTDSGTAVTETPAQSTGTENAVSENTQTPNGSSQERTEGSQQEVGQGRKRWSVQDEIKELRAQRRELREQLSSFGSVRDELSALREEMNRRNQSPTAKTPANFWQDPEAALDTRLQALRDELTESMTSAFHTTREQEFQQQALRQEQASAAEFIRTQQGYHPQDDEDLIEIIENIPNRQHLSPQWVAEFAWLKLQQSRGVGDRSLAKQRASGVQGQPPGQGFGRKQWSRQEFDNAVDVIEKSPHDPKNSELLKELEAAHKEGRVK